MRDHRPDSSARDSLVESEAFRVGDIFSFTEAYVDLTVQRMPGIDRSAMHAILLLTRVSKMVSYDIESRAQRPGGLSSPAFYLAAILWLTGPLESSVAAAISGMTRSAVSSLTKTLVRDGWVVRTHSETDARSVLISLTEEGSARIGAVIGGVNARERHWVSNLTPEETTQLIALLAKLVSPAAPAGASGDQPAET
ncbi:MarR family transcriptional regulator [Herbiconiux sp. 11R-BC]|uniref:MarR family winged helix-turn-helix transcriptional regulator n=1 Tax=Herbiconiux sp. 11R-BC TaxID=3111637 RepID=UPI003BFED750